MKEHSPKHAFLIIAHNQPVVLQTLLRCLDDERNAIFLHVDRKSTQLYETCRTIQLHHAQFLLLEERLSVHWGDISQVRVEYLLFETALSQGPFAYYHLLSGCDLPIKSMDEIHHFFGEHQGKEFVGFWNSVTHQRDLKRKVRYYYFFNRHLHEKQSWKHHLSMPVRNILLALQKGLHIRRPMNMKFRKGSNWASITQAAAVYLVEHKAEVLKRMKYTLCPDEIFLQTWLWNSPFRNQFYDTTDMQRGSMRAIDWERGTPYTWTANDYDELRRSPYLFARKFSNAYQFLIAQHAPTN